MKILRTLIDTKFDNGMGPIELTQFVRGRLYFHLDSLMSLSNSTCEDDLPSIFEFVQAYIELVKVWMSEFPRYLPEYHASLLTPALVCVCKRAAIARLGKELLDGLHKILANFQRYQSLYIKFSGVQVFRGSRNLVKA